MATANASARRNRPTNKGTNTVCHAPRRALKPPSENAAPRAHWASRTRASSSAVTGMNRKANENTIAASSTGTRNRRSGRMNAQSASVSWVEVVV